MTGNQTKYMMGISINDGNSTGNNNNNNNNLFFFVSFFLYVSKGNVAILIQKFAFLVYAIKSEFVVRFS